MASATYPRVDQWHLYVIRLPANDYAATYVGVSKNPRERFSRHCRSRTPIGNAIQLCGRDLVICEVLESGTRDQIYQREIETIAALNTRWPNGYNIAFGGLAGGRDPLPITRAKISAGLRGKKPSNETREKLSARRNFFGRKHTTETRAKLSLAQLGKKHSPETLAKMSASQMARRVAEYRAEMAL